MERVSPQRSTNPVRQDRLLPPRQARRCCSLQFEPRGLACKKAEEWQLGDRPRRSILLKHSLDIAFLAPRKAEVALVIGQTFTLIGSPKLVFRLVWRGSIGGIDCVRGVALNGKFQSFRRAADVVFVEAA